MTVWFDVEDLFEYAASGNKRVSGIQRLTFEVYAAAHALGGAAPVRFVRHGPATLSFEIVEWGEIAAMFGGGGEPERDARWGARAALPGVVADGGQNRGVRDALALAGREQVQAFAALARFGARVAAAPIRGVARAAEAQWRRWRMPRAFRRLAGATDEFAALARPGDTLLVLGSPWNREGYSRIARWLHDTRGMRFGVLMFDLVPIRRPEWCHSGVINMFKGWYDDVLPCCDLVFAISRHTARDVEAYARESGIALPGPVRVLPIGSGFGLLGAGVTVGARPAGLPEPGSYVLFVSTMEARKNHALAVRVWRGLLADVKAGRRAATSVPELVFAGRVGWLVADLIGQLDNTDWLCGRVRLVQDPSDDELRALYEGCLFTLFPSLYEGWGLPVTESLVLGKPCLCSDATALPEAGGALCRYFDPEDVGSAQRAVAAVLDDRVGLAAWEASVRREFRPTAWRETARAVMDGVASLDD